MKSLVISTIAQIVTLSLISGNVSPEMHRHPVMFLFMGVFNIIGIIAGALQIARPSLGWPRDFVVELALLGSIVATGFFAYWYSPWYWIAIPFQMYFLVRNWRKGA